MNHLRLRAVILTCWLVIIYLVVHFWEPLNLSPFIYFYVMILTIFMLGAPNLNKINLSLLLAVPAVLFFGIKVILELPLVGSALMITSIETFAIILTTLLVLWVRGSIREFEDSVAKVTIGQPNKVIESGAEGQGILYREVRRARNHQRPLAILAIALDEKSITSVVDRMVKDAQQTMIRQFTLASVSRTLCDKLEDCDIVVQTNNHFLVVLPETKPDDLPSLIDRLRAQITEKVGVEIKVGFASLPQDSFTLEGLLDKATMEMQGAVNTELFIEPEQLFIKRKTT